MAVNYKICPQCGSKNILRIIYGYPSQELLNAAKQGKVLLGGCVIYDSSPEYECKDCHKQWNKAEIINIAYKSIKRIEAFVGGYFGSNYYADVDLANNKIVWSEGFSEESKYVKDINSNEISNFIEGLRLIDFLNWKRKYVQPYICDGTQWNIDIETNKRRIHIYGDNAFPAQWDEFCSLIQKFTGKPFA